MQWCINAKEVIYSIEHAWRGTDQRTFGPWMSVVKMCRSVPVGELGRTREVECRLSVATEVDVPLAKTLAKHWLSWTVFGGARISLSLHTWAFARYGPARLPVQGMDGPASHRVRAKHRVWDTLQQCLTISVLQHQTTHKLQSDVTVQQFHFQINFQENSTTYNKAKISLKLLV